MAVCGIGEPARAASARIRFHVEPQTYAEALLDIAQQANVTLIGAGSCSGYSAKRLAATLTLEQALDQTLAEAQCAWRLIAPGAVAISPIPRVEPPKAEAPVTVSGVLVTATKRVRNSRELAVAITTIPREGLEATGASDAGEAASQFAGVLVTNLGPGRNKLLLRGLSDGAHAFSAVVESASGIQGARSAPSALRIDTVAPSAPTRPARSMANRTGSPCMATSWTT